jgi:RNA polymerase sigma-70 factor (ECF subfamily)
MAADGADPGTMQHPESAEAVIDAARQGAEWAWRIIYHDLAGPLQGYLRVRGAREPEDLVGEVFVHLARGIGRFRGGGAGLRSWAFVVAHHRLIDERRRIGRRPHTTGDSELEAQAAPDDPEAEALSRLSDDRIRRLLSVLSPAQRDVMALRVLGGLTLEETAGALGKRVGAVKTLQHRAVAALRQAIEKEGVSL